jgi:hypothetical protein
MEREMRRTLASTVGRLLIGLLFASGALAHDSHADGSSTTQAAACKLSMNLARQGIPNDQVIASHCECLENKDDRAAPWSCTAFVHAR